MQIRIVLHLLVLLHDFAHDFATLFELRVLSVKQRQIQIVVQIRLASERPIELRSDLLKNLRLTPKTASYRSHFAMIRDHQPRNARRSRHKRAPLRQDHLNRVGSPRDKPRQLLLSDSLERRMNFRRVHVALNHVERAQIHAFPRVHRRHQVFILQQSSLHVVHARLPHRAGLQRALDERRVRGNEIMKTRRSHQSGHHAHKIAVYIARIAKRRGNCPRCSARPRWN